MGDFHMDFYDRQGVEIDIEEYARLWEEGPQVEQEDVLTPSGDMCWVSTVWLGVDHNWFGDGPPLIFETAIFWADHTDIWARYPTEKAAREGHALLIAALTTGLETQQTTEDGI